MVQFMESTKLSTQSLCSIWGLFTNKGFSVSKEPPTKSPSHRKDSLEILLATRTGGVERVVCMEEASREIVAKLPWLGPANRGWQA